MIKHIERWIKTAVFKAACGKELSGGCPPTTTNQCGQNRGLHLVCVVAGGLGGVAVSRVVGGLWISMADWRDSREDSGTTPLAQESTREGVGSVGECITCRYVLHTYVYKSLNSLRPIADIISCFHKLIGIYMGRLILGAIH